MLIWGAWEIIHHLHCRQSERSTSLLKKNCNVLRARHDWSETHKGVERRFGGARCLAVPMPAILPVHAVTPPGSIAQLVHAGIGTRFGGPAWPVAGGRT